MRISDWSSDVCSSDLAGSDRSLVRISFSFCLSVLKRSPKPLALASTRRNRSSLISSDTVVAEFTRRSEEHTSELQSLMRISYAVFCLKKKHNLRPTTDHIYRSLRQVSACKGHL